MSKPKVTTRCVANTYAATNKRIIEFSDADTGKGGLIAFRSRPDGKLQVDVYRCDIGVIINGVETTESNR